MKKFHNTIGGRLVTLIIVLFFLGGGGLLWWREGTAAPDPADTKPTMFIVRKGEGVRSVVNRLAEEGLIGSKTSFYLLVKLMGIERDIQAGNFRLNRAMDARTMAQELTHGVQDIWVTTLEGWRVEEIATQLTRELDIPEQEFLKVATEGYMFPDTYLIPRDATPAQIVEIFLNTFNKKITLQMREDAKKTGLTFSQVISLASIVEREGHTDEDRPMIAGILRKRLQADWPLQVDATIQYALGYQADQKSWWKKTLSEEDKKMKSPYNTYLHTGLPPTPISNPGFAAIRAVLYATPSDYWFYLHDRTGGVHYAKTIEEHTANIEKYLQ